MYIELRNRVGYGPTIKLQTFSMIGSIILNAVIGRVISKGIGKEKKKARRDKTVKG